MILQSNRFKHAVILEERVVRVQLLGWDGIGRDGMERNDAREKRSWDFGCGLVRWLPCDSAYGECIRPW